MVIGFTGTRTGMSYAQRQQFAQIFGLLMRAAEQLGVGITFHHGAAAGADMQACALAEHDGLVSIVAHPAGNDPLARNRDIVAESDMLIAAPLTDLEEVRSGTWATVRYARKAGKPVIMLSRGGG